MLPFGTFWRQKQHHDSINELILLRTLQWISCANLIVSHLMASLLAILVAAPLECPLALEDAGNAEYFQT